MKLYLLVGSLILLCACGVRPGTGGTPPAFKKTGKTATCGYYHVIDGPREASFAICDRDEADPVVNWNIVK